MADKKNQKQEEKIKLYKMQNAARKSKNRSSKHLRWLTGMKPIQRCLSGEALREFANNGNIAAQIEIQRRAKKAAKKAAKGL